MTIDLNVLRSGADYTPEVGMKFIIGETETGEDAIVELAPPTRKRKREAASRHRANRAAQEGGATDDDLMIQLRDLGQVVTKGEWPPVDYLIDEVVGVAIACFFIVATPMTSVQQQSLPHQDSTLSTNQGSKKQDGPEHGESAVMDGTKSLAA